MAAAGREADPREIDPSGMWADLLDDARERDVVVLDPTGSRAADRLEAAGARVRRITTGQLADLSPGCADAVVTCGLPGTAWQLRQLKRLLRPGGVLLLVAGNVTSPLRLADTLSRLRPDANHRPRAGSAYLPALLRRLTAVGLPARATYGVLRSVEAPTTFFELGHPQTAAAVLAASSTRITGGRQQLVRLLGALLRRGRAGPVVPGMALLCSAAPLHHEPALGQIAVLDSYESKLLYGEPVTHVDKGYPDAELATAEAEALEAVGRAWPGLAPQLLARLTPTRNRLSWVSGHTLAVGRLAPDEGRRWVLAAAELLGELHRRMDAGPGLPVRVHGDYWLGNLLVDAFGARLVGVIDWSDTGWGSIEDDLDHLVGTWVRQAGLEANASAHLRADARNAARAAGITPTRADAFPAAPAPATIRPAD